MTTPEMTAERFARIRAVYLAADKLSGGERDAYLSEACAGDPALETDVRELLARGDPEERPIDELVAGVAKSIADSMDDESAIDAVGPYRVLETLGRGGMGRVLLAERADGHYEQRVAIKVVDRHRSTPELVSRFRGERQILASLDHPNIARLFDGGETDNGVPYFVMEYVDGVPVDRYCDDRCLSIRERLELFVEICAAIEYAHRNLVVHRDIKPSNILITAGGMPKLLDFGIAKLLSRDSIDYTMAVTVGDVRLMTPRNASPEQIRGETITTATDIYALGLLLYQLLTGHFPFEPSGTQAYELERLICETDPARPSAAVTRSAGESDEASTPESISAARRVPTTEQLRKQLRGDLDNIVMVAIRKEPERRYATVRQLADDVQNYLEHRPVRARGDSFGYRATKFLRRNPGGVVLVGSMIVIVAVLISVYTYRLAVERDRAALEATKAREVAGFMTDLFREADPRQSTGNPVTAGEMLDRGARRVRSGLSEQAELQASLMATIGESYHNMWELSKARAHLAESLETAEMRLGEDHPDVVRIRHFLGRSTALQGDYEDALQLHRQNHELLVDRHGRQSAEAATELHQIAYIQSASGDYEMAEATFTDVIEIFRGLGADGNSGLATGLMEYGSLLRSLGRVQENADAQLEALQIRRDLYGEHHPDYLAVVNNVANSFFARNRLEEAERYMRENVRLSREIFGADAIPYAVAILNLASLRHLQGHYEEAAELHREVEPIYREGYGEDHPRYAYLHENMANTMELRHDYEGAEANFLKAMSILAAEFGPDHLEVAITRSRYGTMLNNAERYEEAIEQLTRAVETMAEAFGESHSRTIFARTSLGTALDGVGRYGDAIEMISKSLQATAASPEHLRYDRVHTMNRLAKIHSDNENFKEAQTLSRDAVETWEAMGVLDNPALSFVDVTYAEALTAQGDTQSAAAHLENRLGVFVEAFGRDDANTTRLADALSAIE